MFTHNLEPILFEQTLFESDGALWPYFRSDRLVVRKKKFFKSLGI